MIDSTCLDGSLFCSFGLLAGEIVGSLFVLKSGTEVCETSKTSLRRRYGQPFLDGFLMLCSRAVDRLFVLRMKAVNALVMD
jgi:hypothetical protein